ncbi:lipoprotein [Mycoplasma feriruminatoris]|uniref:lipoprotein n=1 Tax=Mycoplasma feriruminatoris TaxID=1179777 RepID=UPI00241FA419|nr:lipoprotein [Mycoplasma feriruminatoris]WFQ90226.1 hypothetical protein MFERI11561_00477 [Mycoplasma feriruminatoris]
MKKFISILSAILLISSSSFLLVSCTRNSNNINTEKKSENIKKSENNLLKSKPKTDSDKSDKKENKEDLKNDGNISTPKPNNKDNISNVEQNDQPNDNNEWSDKASKEKERVSTLLKDLTKVDEIKEFAEELIFKNQDFYVKKIKNEEWNKYKEKILNLFKEKKFENIKKELQKLLEEILGIVKDKKPFEKKQETYKDFIVTESLKDSILVELKFFFETKFSVKQKQETEKVISKFIEEMTLLINNKNVKELEKKLIDLIEQNEKLQQELKNITD